MSIDTSSVSAEAVAGSSVGARIAKLSSMGEK